MNATDGTPSPSKADNSLGSDANVIAPHPKRMNALSIISGEARGVGPTVVRGLLRVAEPLYATLMRGRNRLYDAGILRSYDLGRPTISVGNLTTGGTGKTPMVRWIVEQLRARGHRPAVLMRGYTRSAGQLADEPALLRQLLGEQAIVEANPDRVAGAAAVLGRDPSVDVFVLDDGFQHRRARRDFDLLLVSATHPFGYGHVLPRGLLREPVAGARRASAIVITHADQVTGEDLEQIQSCLPDRPMFRARHVLESLEDLRGQRYVLFSAIGDPRTFERQVATQLGPPVATRRFADHHAYTREDVEELVRLAETSNANVLLTTQKDGVKLEGLEAASSMSVRTVGMRMAVEESAGLVGQMLGAWG